MISFYIFEPNFILLNVKGVWGRISLNSHVNSLFLEEIYSRPKGSNKLPTFVVTWHLLISLFYCLNVCVVFFSFTLKSNMMDVPCESAILTVVTVISFISRMKNSLHWRPHQRCITVKLHGSRRALVHYIITASRFHIEDIFPEFILTGSVSF